MGQASAPARRGSYGPRAHSRSPTVDDLFLLQSEAGGGSIAVGFKEVVAKEDSWNKQSGA